MIWYKLYIALLITSNRCFHHVRMLLCTMFSHNYRMMCSSFVAKPDIVAVGSHSASLEIGPGSCVKCALERARGPQMHKRHLRIMYICIYNYTYTFIIYYYVYIYIYCTIIVKYMCIYYYMCDICVHIYTYICIHVYTYSQSSAYQYPNWDSHEIPWSQGQLRLNGFGLSS